MLNGVLARLVERHGTRVEGLDHLGLTHLFPSAAALLEADDPALRALAS